MTRTRALFLLIFLSFAVPGLYLLIFPGKNDLDEFADELQVLIDARSISANMKSFATKPHRAGTPENHAVGERIIKELQASGVKVWTTEYSVELPERGQGSLLMTFPVRQEINYSEKFLEQDPYTRIAQEEQPYFAYVPNSELEGDVIYANFGDREDYEYFKKQGIPVAGKIALVRTQGICRGMKQMIAEEEGLAGILLYPDPRDQGFKKIAYPKGPSINPWVAQRGSMLKFFLYPGDPYSPVKDERTNTLPTVAALPITPEAAKSILQKLEGASNDAWKGWMDVSYNNGPGPARVRIRYKTQRQQKKIRNIFATLGGSNAADPVLMISSHYDAWIYGASDPSSGTAVVLEVAKALSGLEKKGWKPKRNIVFGFWDAEEFGMIGSTQWVLNHLPEARGKIGNLLFVDSVRGPMFKANVLPGLRGLLDQSLSRFTDPNTGKSVLDFHVQYDMPGFSDDTIPFSNLAGVPLAQLNYGLHYTMYHSIYDNLAWMEQFGDPGYAYVANLARIVGLYAIILTREERLPFRFSEFASHYERELSKIRLENVKEEERIRQFNETIRIIKELGLLGVKFDDADLSEISSENKKRINELLLQAILCFTEFPGRTSVPFVTRNIIVGPSVEDGCAGIELPGIRRALEADRSDELEVEMDRLRRAISRSKEFLQQAASLLESNN